MKLKALLLENIHPLAGERLRDAGLQVEALPKSLSKDDFALRLRGISVLGIRSKTRVTAELLKSFGDVLAVGCFCVGTDNVDLEACGDAGVAVFNAPYSNTLSVAELVIGEIIMLLRCAFAKSTLMHEGIWDKSSDGSREVRGKRLGIIGYGNIGAQVGILAEALGMEVRYYDIMEKLSMGNAKRCRSQRELLRSCDVVTVHVDDRPRNAGLLGAREFRCMRPGSVLINASLGRIADLKALAESLRSGRLSGAAVDVFPEEPESGKAEFHSSLRGLRNVILTPHIGGSTQEAQREIGSYVSDKLSQYLKTGDTFYSVNFPQVSLPVLKGQHRLLHAHKNVPGVMSQINSIMAANGINITGQYLETKGRIGYAITDIEAKYDAKVLDSLRQIRETIRLRVLY